MASKIGVETTTQPFTVTILQKARYKGLKDALYEIRSEVLDGKLPVVFFEGFDIYSSEDDKLSWLKYFLSPMQDGKFFDNGCDQHIGPAVFIFVQGESDHFTGFPRKQPDGSAFFKEAKGPDFVSRLRGCVKKDSNEYQPLENVIKWYLRTTNDGKPLSIGMFKPRDHCPLKRTFKDILATHVNVLGPNRVNKILNDLFVTRRAILLRFLLTRMLKIPEDQEISIDGNVLNALLSIPGFRHGARSIESTFIMSQVLRMKDKKERFTGNHLPPIKQRELHVDAEEFGECLKKEFSEFKRSPDRYIQDRYFKTGTA